MPTTFNPTTFNPTTFNPTTYNPTTFNATTFNPTTYNPTTFNPTTSMPTTSMPTTSIPTTQNYAACANPIGTDVEFIADKVYGCRGAFTGGMDGVEAAAICATGYEICENSNKMHELGMTRAMCSDENLIDENTFFATRQGSDSSINCGVAKGAYVLGCSRSGENMLIGHNDARTTNIRCGVISNLLWSNHIGAGIQGWSNMFYNNAYNPVVNSNPANGGVMCCKTTPEPAQDLTQIGCNNVDGIEFVNDKIYGCRGVFIGIHEQGPNLCADDYEVCPTGERANFLGLTKDICGSVPRELDFFGTFSRGPTCVYGEGVDWMFGCANQASLNGGYMGQSLYLENYPCNMADAFNAGIKMGAPVPHVSWQFVYSNRGPQYGSPANFDARYGGVMCCKKDPNECDLGVDNCGANSECVDEVPLFRCEIMAEQKKEIKV